MSDVDRAELRRLLAEATPGPWWQEWVEGDEWYAVYGQPTGDLVCPEVCTAGDADDTNLLVAAVNALPGLLDALDAIHGLADRIADHYGDNWDHTPACLGEPACPLCHILYIASGGTPGGGSDD